MIIPTLFVILLGLVLGSFLFTMAMRLQNEVSVWKSSHCDHCGKNVGIIGLIPIVGYGLLAGKCRHCKNKISIAYPIAEIVNAVLVYSIYYKIGWRPEFFYFLLLFESLLLIAIIDFRSYLIYCQPVLFGLIIQCIWLFFAGKEAIFNSLLGMFVGAGVFHWIAYLYKVLRNKDGLGEGDATLLGLIGFFFGWNFLFPVIFWGAAFGIAGGGLTLILKKQSLSKEIAFGPWLILAAFLAWYFPDFFRTIPINIPDSVVLPI